MYKINDYVVYGMQGACKVKDITEVDFGHKGTLYYELVSQDGKESEIFVNVENGEKKMRSLMTKEQAKDMLDGISDMKGIWIPDNKERERTYKQAIVSGNYEEILEILKGLYQRREARVKQGKRQTELDDRIYRNTKRILFGEMALVLETDMDSLEKEVLKKIS